MKKFLISTLFFLIGSTSLLATGDGTGSPVILTAGDNDTPTVYDVTVTKIRFKKSDNSYFTYFSGSGVMHLGSASTAANATAGALGSGVPLPNDTYSEIEITISRDIVVNAGTTNAGRSIACYTDSTKTSSDTEDVTGPITLPSAKTTGSATNQTITVVPPQVVTTVNNSSYFDLSSGSTTLVMRFPVSFSVADGVPPVIDVKFDVADSIEFLTTSGSTCVVLVLPPQVTFTIDGTSTTTALTGYVY